MVEKVLVVTPRMTAAIQVILVAERRLYAVGSEEDAKAKLRLRPT
jgi:hypothetical protein